MTGILQIVMGGPKPISEGELRLPVRTVVDVASLMLSRFHGGLPPEPGPCILPNADAVNAGTVMVLTRGADLISDKTHTADMAFLATIDPLRGVHGQLAFGRHPTPTRLSA